MTMMKAPEKGVAVRMYRQGHGDCFLLAFPRQGGGDPVYVLIDCGYKPGSQTFLHDKSIGDIVDHIGESTNNRLDLMIITHEHQDHVNGIWKKKHPYFERFTIREAWFAWTEDPHDELANELRKRHRDQLLSLLEARKKLAFSVGEQDSAVHRLDDLLSLEVGDTKNRGVDDMLAAARDPAKSVNKQAMKLVKDKAAKKRGIRYFSPGEPPVDVKGTSGVRAFVLGPPRDEDLLQDENPVGSEGFPNDRSGAHGLTFSAAALASPRDDSVIASPFRPTYRVPVSDAHEYVIPDDNGIEYAFFDWHYGQGVNGTRAEIGKEVPTDAAWRRIDDEWLYSAETLALKLNRGINNTSLVLAFELPKTKKVLLFVGDAQRGNWISWTDNEWPGADGSVTVKDLLSRTVLYKVGHHASHNATLDGSIADDYANLSWMGLGERAGEFTAMITAVNEWAMTMNNPPWRHPFPAIRKALEDKCQGRIFQTDIPIPLRPDDVPVATWQEFMSRATAEELYFEYVIRDDTREG